jgi:hypothetical protein
MLHPPQTRLAQACSCFTSSNADPAFYILGFTAQIGVAIAAQVAAKVGQLNRFFTFVVILIVLDGAQQYLQVRELDLRVFKGLQGIFNNYTRADVYNIHVDPLTVSTSRTIGMRAL